MIFACDEIGSFRVPGMPMDRLWSFSGEFWAHFLMLAATSKWPRGAPLGPIGTPGSKKIQKFIDTIFK